MTPPVQVSVEDAAGNPVASGVDVTLTLTNPVESLNVATRRASNGIAVFSDLIITRAFGRNSLRARGVGGIDEGISTEFAVLPGPAAALLIGSGDGQVASPGGTLLQRPVVVVTDEFGNPVPGVSVTFEVTSGGGTVEGAQATTSADGAAQVTSWTLGSSLGPNTLRATAATLTSVTFTATAVALPTAITIEVHDDFFRSVRNGSGSNGPGYSNQPRDTIAVGGTVTWVWMGQNHNLRRDFTGNEAPPLDLSGNQDAPFTVGPITLSSAGNVYYRCTNHSYLDWYPASGMAGTILVR